MENNVTLNQYLGQSSVLSGLMQAGNLQNQLIGQMAYAGYGQTIYVTPTDPLNTLVYEEPRKVGSKADARKDRCDCHLGPASQHHSILERLRMEIREWHGNVLNLDYA